MERKALYAGSFDPITNGHLNIIERAARVYDTLTVAVVENPNKKSFFNIDERVNLAKEAVKHLPNVKIDKFSGLLADYVNEGGFATVIRGLRDSVDFQNEMQMANMNSRLYKGDTETVFLMGNPEYSYISSSLIKEVASLGGDVSGLVPDCVLDGITNKLQEESK